MTTAHLSASSMSTTVPRNPKGLSPQENDAMPCLAVLQRRDAEGAESGREHKGEHAVHGGVGDGDVGAVHRDVHLDNL